MSETDSNWKSIYRVGGAAALILLVYSPATMVLLIAVGGQPAHGKSWRDNESCAQCH